MQPLLRHSQRVFLRRTPPLHPLMVPVREHVRCNLWVVPPCSVVGYGGSWDSCSVHECGAPHWRTATSKRRIIACTACTLRASRQQHTRFMRSHQAGPGGAHR